MVYYTTKYGSSKAIAFRLAECLQESSVNLNEADRLAPDPIPVIVMPLYAGGLYQAKRARDLLDRSGCTQLILISVGLSDPTRKVTEQAIAESVKKSFPNRTVHLYSTRGGIDYSALTVKHKAMMWMLKKMVERNPDEAENRQILETYGQTVNLMDFNEVEQIARKIQHLRKQDR